MAQALTGACLNAVPGLEVAHEVGNPTLESASWQSSLELCDKGAINPPSRHALSCSTRQPACSTARSVEDPPRAPCTSSVSVPCAGLGTCRIEPRAAPYAGKRECCFGRVAGRCTLRAGPWGSNAARPAAGGQPFRHVVGSYASGEGGHPGRCQQAVRRQNDGPILCAVRKRTRCSPPQTQLFDSARRCPPLRGLPCFCGTRLRRSPCVQTTRAAHPGRRRCACPPSPCPGPRRRFSDGRPCSAAPPTRSRPAPCVLCPPCRIAGAGCPRADA